MQTCYPSEGAPIEAATLTISVTRYGLASSTMLNGVSAARRKRVKPPSATTSRNLASPACAPSAKPTSWSREAGVHTSVDAP